MDLIIGTLQQGVLFGLLAIGIYISFKVLNIPDLTAEGSFTFGLVVSAMVSISGHPVLGVIAGSAAGFAAGIITGLLQTKCGIHPVLAGILTMSALYSTNTWVLGEKPSVTLIGYRTIFSIVSDIFSCDDSTAKIIVIAVLTALVCAVFIFFFRTRLGLSIRAAGNNETMVRASSINVDAVKIFAIAVSNCCIGLCGAVYAQYQRFADINSGAGMLVVGLASVIIGEVLNIRKGLTSGLILVIAGSVVYRAIIAVATYYDVFPAYMLKFVAAVIVAAALTVPAVKSALSLKKAKMVNKGGAGNA